MAAVRGLGPTSLAALGLQTHVAHEPLDPASRMAAPFSAQFSVDAGCAIDPPLGCEDATDVAAQLGFRLRARFCAIPSSWGAQVPYRTLHSTQGKPPSAICRPGQRSGMRTRTDLPRLPSVRAERTANSVSRSTCQSRSYRNGVPAPSRL